MRAAVLPRPVRPGPALRAAETPTRPGRFPCSWAAGICAWPAVPAACVCSTIELTGGHAEAGEPAGQLVGVVGRISTLSGLNVHDAWLGRPEHESVTNIGDVSAEGFTGTIVTLIVPALPAVSTRGSADGATGAKRQLKTGRRCWLESAPAYETEAEPR